MKDEKGVYSPRLDVAVGPFATNQRFIEEYNYLMETSRQFIDNILIHHKNNIRQFDNEIDILSFKKLKNKNANARCLLAIEIENRVSRKHLMGGVINAAALG